MGTHAVKQKPERVIQRTPRSSRGASPMAWANWRSQRRGSQILRYGTASASSIAKPFRKSFGRPTTRSCSSFGGQEAAGVSALPDWQCWPHFQYAEEDHCQIGGVPQVRNLSCFTVMLCCMADGHKFPTFVVFNSFVTAGNWPILRRLTKHFFSAIQTD